MWFSYYGLSYICSAGLISRHSLIIQIVLQPFTTSKITALLRPTGIWGSDDKRRGGMNVEYLDESCVVNVTHSQVHLSMDGVSSAARAAEDRNRLKYGKLQPVQLWGLCCGNPGSRVNICENPRYRPFSLPYWNFRWPEGCHLVRLMWNTGKTTMVFLQSFVELRFLEPVFGPKAYFNMAGFRVPGSANPWKFSRKMTYLKIPNW